VAFLLATRLVSVWKYTHVDAMKRVNLILSREDSVFLDKLAREIDDRVGARVSRSEIVRASIAGMRELHRLAPLCPARFSPLAGCKNEAALAVQMLLAIRAALPEGSIKS
jgi:hypothetical protein